MVATALVMVFSFPGAHSIVLAQTPSGNGTSPSAGASHLATVGSSPTIVPSVHGAASPVASAASTASAGHATHLAPVSLWNNSAGCQARQDKWNALFGDIAPPTDVRHTEQSPCYIGHDEPGLNFVSNDSGSGSRVQFMINLPQAGTYTGSAFATMWVGMWLAGVPCSYRGQSYLEIQINPPDNAIGLTSNPNWTVQAPVWDLVPVGSCDPQCQNDTAVDTIGGVNYCEDDAALSGVGTYTSTGWGNFAPGDQLIVQMVGEVGSSSGLTCFINDTTNPSANLNWTYSANVTASGLPLTPFYDASGWQNDGWGYGLNVEATWENCPEGLGPQSCNSYNGPAVSAVNVPTFTSATFWNDTTESYSNPFPWTAMTSSAGACSGYAAPCLDYTSYGGTGFYPYWSLHAFGGQSWWTYGGSYPNEVTNWGQASQFNPFGFIPTYTNPTTVYHVEASQVGTNLNVVAAVADPNGVGAVEVGGFWCFSGSTPSVLTTTGTLAGGPWDTAQQGNWTATLPTNNMHGTLNYWVRGQSVSGIWSNPVWNTISVSGGSACGFAGPATPGFGLSNIVPVGGGYNLTWTESSPGIANYTIWFNATTNGTPFSVDVDGAGTAAFENLYWDNQSFNISIVAWDYSGLASAPTAWITAPATLFSLGADIAAPTTPIWVNSGPVTITGFASNGEGPFTYRFIFGDGSVMWANSPNDSLTVTHDYGSYFGGARANVSVWDSLGDAAFSGRVIILIQASPLGVPQTIVGGDGFVQVSWSAPVSPAAPVTYYTVYYTQSPDWAWALTEFWPYNYSAPYDTFEWNTTATSLAVPVANGATLYAQVVAWNSFREGLLPDGSPILQATAMPLSVVSVSGPSGGAAPYTATFTAAVTDGTNDVVTNAVYTFTGGATVVPSMGGGPGAYWLNATYTFPSPGPATATVTVTDQFNVVRSGSTTVFIGPGAAPSVTVTLGQGPAWVGSPVTFAAAASGGSGAYSFDWAFGDGVTGTGSGPSHSYASAGTFTAVLTTTDTTTGGWTTTSTAVEVFALPQVSISSTHGTGGDLSYVFTAVGSGGSGALTYAWDFGDGQTGSGTSASHDFGSAGTYTVTVTATDPSGKGTTSSVTVEANVVSNPNTLSLSGTNGLVMGLLGFLVVIFLLGMIYFWMRSRRPPMVMAPETASSPPKPSS